MEVAMDAMRAAALPKSGAGENARPRPELRVLYSAETATAPAPVAASPAAPSPVTASPSAAPVVPGHPVPAPCGPARAVATPSVLARAVPAPRTTSELRMPVRPVAARRVSPGPTQATSPLRLTRRGRVVVAAAAVLLVAALSLIVAGAAQAISHSAAPGAARSGLAQVAVRPGQNLWSVAENADPDADTRLVIQQIIQLNALAGDTVFAGQRLWVPRS
jgi:hypothetical protein